MNGFIDIYSVIFLVLAIVIFLRLRSVLGRRTGSERPPFDPYSRREVPKPAAGEDKVISLPRRTSEGEAPKADSEAAAEERVKTAAPAGSALKEALVAIAKADRSFDPEQFVAGAKIAYEMIVTAYAEGDRRNLKNLLARDVYEGFEAAIREREQRGEVAETRFVSIDSSDLIGAEQRGTVAHLTIRFVSQLVSVTRDKAGTVIDGSPDKVTDVTDVWTFARDVTSRDPNWKLVATETGP